MEIWDLYDENRRLTGETMIRGNRVPEGRYHLVVDALFLNSRGETLLQRRAHDKPVMPDIWSVTGGSALRGEDSAAAIRRETQEEMGFTPDLENGKVLLSDRMTGETGGYFRDVWLFFQSVPLEEMRFQPEEVQDGQWILPEKIAADETLSAQLGQLRFWKRAFPRYLFLRTAFAFFDFNASRALFFLDYIAILALFAGIGYFLSTVLPRLQHTPKNH